MQTRWWRQPGRATVVLRDAALVVVATVGIFLLAAHLDLIQAFAAWSRRHEGLNVDALVIAAFILVVGLAVFALQRHREALAEARLLAEAERALADTNERFRSLFDYHPHGVFSLDRRGRFVSANRACERLSGYTESDLQTMAFTDIVTPEDLDQALAKFERVKRREHVYAHLTMTHRDGHPVELSVTALPIVVADETVGMYGIAEDITQQRRTQRDLARSRQAVVEAGEAKSLFLAKVSHEIRTPLTSVLAVTELLTGTDLDEEQSELVHRMSRSGTRLLRLVNDVLDFSKLQAGTLTVDAVDVDLELLVEEAVQSVAASARAKGLELATSVDPRLPPTVRGDPERILQVLGNLLSNAVKFTDTGRVRLVVEPSDPEPGERPGPLRAVFRVSDTGIGISLEEQARLFHSFSQADESITRKYGGTGLGLAICKQLVALMGGSIWITSTPGRGSTFSFQLPLERCDSSDRVDLTARPVPPRSSPGGDPSAVL